MSEVKTDGYVNDDEYNDKMRIERNSYLIQTEQLTEELLELQNRYADLERENKELRKIQLELNIENANLKDMVLDNGGDYTDVWKKFWMEGIEPLPKRWIRVYYIHLRSIALTAVKWDLKRVTDGNRQKGS